MLLPPSYTRHEIRGLTTPFLIPDRQILGVGRRAPPCYTQSSCYHTILGKWVGGDVSWSGSL